MWKKAKNLLLYARLDKEQFEKVSPLVTAENSFYLRLAAIVQALYFGVSLTGSLGYDDMADKRLAYGIGTAIPLAVLIIYFLIGKKHPSIVQWLVRICCAGIFLTGLLCTLICTPDEMTILLLIFFFCVPMLFVGRPLELIILVLAADVVYFVAAPFTKTQDVLSMDMIDVGMFSTLSVILGVSHLIGRYRRFWLETDAVDLAEVRYKAAFIDQLTGTFNRNAYNRDSENLGKKALPLDFMMITLDLNGLKDANDTFGHIAGDELIVGAADCMKKCFADYGNVYRVGGDEFIIMINTKGTPEGEIMNSFNRIIDEWHGVLVKNLSVSYGVVMGNEAKNMTFHEMELLADKRMYQSKSDYYKNSGHDRRRH